MQDERTRKFRFSEINSCREILKVFNAGKTRSVKSQFSAPRGLRRPLGMRSKVMRSNRVEGEQEEQVRKAERPQEAPGLPAAAQLGGGQPAANACSAPPISPPSRSAGSWCCIPGRRSCGRCG